MNSTWARYSRWLPGPAELVFGTILGMILIGGRHALLDDPGTSWHLRLGRDILATGSVPRFDTLTFTHEQDPWVDQSWAFDVLLAAVVNSWGWSGAIGLAALGLAALYATLARGLIRDGTSPIVAIVVALLAAGIGSIHFLIRPHLFTFAFVYLTFRACQKQHEKGGWHVAAVPVYTAILANLHGGFVALPLIVATAGFGHVISGPWDPARRRELIRFAGVFGASILAALLNPYGFGLYRHVARLLVSSGVTSLIIEYQPAPFGKPEAEALEWALLGLVALPVVSSRRIDRYFLPHVLVWLHLALTSIRNAPIFAMAAAPALAVLIDGLPILYRRSWKSVGARPVWVPAVTTAVVLLVAVGVKLGGFDTKKWPLPALASLNAQPASARLFHEQDWGGLIAAECRPPRHTYLDDRFELFGKEAIIEYVDVLSGGPAWDDVRDRDHIDLVWLRPERGLARRLRKEPGWDVVYQDKVSVLMKHAPTGRVAAR
ncbi:MAG: hypothetical protein ACLQIB_57495 [Isosphaeraceae bacterium]